MRFATASLIVTTIACVSYLAWVFLSRHLDNRRLEAAAEEREAKANRELTKVLGDGRLKIHTFYLSPTTVQPGGKSLLCYGVTNAKSVRLEPPVDTIAPSLSRCLEVRPKATTTYTLIAEDGSGGRQEQSVKVIVSRAAP